MTDSVQKLANPFALDAAVDRCQGDLSFEMDQAIP